MKMLDFSGLSVAVKPAGAGAGRASVELFAGEITTSATVGQLVKPAFDTLGRGSTFRDVECSITKIMNDSRKAGYMLRKQSRVVNPR